MAPELRLIVSAPPLDYPARALSRAASNGESGRYWARTSDPQLVELVLSQLS